MQDNKRLERCSSMVAGLKPNQEKNERRNLLRHLNKKRYVIKFKKYEKAVKEVLEITKKIAIRLESEFWEDDRDPVDNYLNMFNVD
jgi:predicted nucleic acid-binding protein